MHTADEDAPYTSPYAPEAQPVQAVLPTESQYDPNTQLKHVWAPTPLYLPAPHGMQASDELAPETVP